jgi:hypothetical protein
MVELYRVSSGQQIAVLLPGLRIQCQQLTPRKEKSLISGSLASHV